MAYYSSNYYYEANSEFNEPEFEEYDPTPYGGGYDLDATYGKPLPPSEGICYPRSSGDPNDQSLKTFSYGSIESPYGKGVDKLVEKPSNGSKTATVKDQEQQTQGSNEAGNVGSNGKPVESYQGEENKESYTDGYPYGAEYEKRVSQIPPGYGLEAMDLCESLFGYSPCLDRAKRENDYRNCYGPQGVNCPWEETADYLLVIRILMVKDGAVEVFTRTQSSITKGIIRDNLYQGRWSIKRNIHG
ncbi:uncharacterized protein At5g39570 isoform X2 [Gossypium hirsutum]|uniref:Uncharacterized protein At5g39570 isoform X2 n=1 Tax=Gossypium hirsutum TaxID=3635 RepID=A0A1U8LTT5_GOSHI|nr:uncharacterized protein At5g39570-like isoform X2 [Gossypium hirsutum]